MSPQLTAHSTPSRATPDRITVYIKFKRIHGFLNLPEMTSEFNRPINKQAKRCYMLIKEDNTGKGRERYLRNQESNKL